MKTNKLFPYFVAVSLMLLGTWVMAKRKHVEEGAITGIQQILIHLEAARMRPGAT